MTINIHCVYNRQKMTRRVPSFTGLKPASAISSKVKSKNLRRDTKQEIMLRSTLWHMGLRYQKNVESLPGKPDIVFPRVKVVVFCDGDFWHGRSWKKLNNNLQKRANPEYWTAKIIYNMERDKKNKKILKAQGWYVIRLWETDIKHDPIAAAKYIEKIVKARKK